MFDRLHLKLPVPSSEFKVRTSPIDARCSNFIFIFRSLGFRVQSRGLSPSDLRRPRISWLATVVFSLWLTHLSLGAPLSDPAVDDYNVRLATQTFAGLYQFTTNTLLVETAQAIRGLGCDTIKLYLGNSYPRQYHFNLAPNVTNLLTLSRDDPSCRSVLGMPFRHIIAWAYPFGNGDAPFTDGNYTSAEQADDYREMYDLTQYLLTNYNNSGKTFYLGHWEGDGYLSVNNWSTNPSPAVIQGMILWENTRQKAVDDAKAKTAFSNVNVYYYAEANRVRDAMVNGPDNNQRVINMVVPYVTNLDLISYSSYDAMNLDSNSLYSTLDYMMAKLPTAKASPALGQRLWIGEYGWGGDSTAAQEPLSRAYVQRLLNWGPRFILFWEIYNNETNRNFCLIDPTGAKVPCYYLHQRFINQARLATAQFKETHSRLPGDSEFAGLLGPMLNQPLPPPVSLTLSNLPPALTGTSATLAGQLTQGIYGDDQAAVWVFWGKQDGGPVRANWESARFLGVNTNFNPSKFSTTVEGLATQTNYHFRFYATNAAGEAWAPTSAFFSTQTLNPADYGSRMEITFSGYNRAGGLADFPVLLALNTNLTGFSYYRFASPNGGDLRFTDASGSMMVPHEIDEWDTGGTSYVWVKVPELAGTNESLWAYWGNPLATNPPAWSTNGSTWLPGYQSVWHLKESHFPYQDSLQNDPIVSGGTPGSAPGIVGHGLLFDGSMEYLNAGVVGLSNAFTFSAWVNIDPSATGIQTVCANKPGGWNTDGFALYVNTYLTTDHKLLFESGNGTNGQTAATAANLVTPGIWHQVAAVVDQATASVRLYVDGVDQTQSIAVQADFNARGELDLGRFTNGSYYFKGAIDEVRIEQGGRSPDWIWANWSTIAQNSALASYAQVALQPMLLSVSVLPTGLVAKWAASGVGLALFSATNLAPPALWQRVTNLPSLINGQWQIAPSATNGSYFFRLQAP